MIVYIIYIFYDKRNVRVDHTNAMRTYSVRNAHVQ